MKEGQGVVKNKTTATANELGAVNAEVENTDLKNLLENTFKNEVWFQTFLNDNHHGYKHGNQVRISCLKLLDSLTIQERQSAEGCTEDSVLAMEIAAILHDCGRFNDDGLVLAHEQKLHHELSAKRARTFCESNGFSNVLPIVEDAILCHDYQCKSHTPHLDPPRTLIGKIVQSADQMGWFHPDSVNRTLEYNKTIGNQFYDPSLNTEQRIDWKPGQKSGDALTVMLGQLFGPTGPDRFGIKAAREKIEKYKSGLRENILKIAQSYGIEKEIAGLIVDYEANLLNKSR